MERVSRGNKMMFLPKHKGIIYDEKSVEEVKSIDRIVLDEVPADNGNKKNQDEWFDYWNSISDSRVMASMGDLYIAFKDLKNKVEQGSDVDKNKFQRLLKSLRDDFDWPGKNNWLIAGTRLEYNGNDLNARITQHYKCNRPEIVKDITIEVPVYRGVPVAQVVSDVKGLAYLQTLFDTTDDAEIIIQTLEFISRRNRKDIIIWTADSSDRGSVPSRVAGLDYYNNSQFHIYGNGDISSNGRSRGVKIK